MELILLQKVTNLGNLGDKVNVKPGYGRNFLVPKGKAVPATAANLAEFEAKRAEYEAKAKALLDDAEAPQGQARRRERHHLRQRVDRRQAVRLGRPARHRRGVDRRRHAGREVGSRDGRRPAPPHRRVRRARAPARRRRDDRQGRSSSGRSRVTLQAVHRNTGAEGARFRCGATSRLRCPVCIPCDSHRLSTVLSATLRRGRWMPHDSGRIATCQGSNDCR